MLLVLSCQAVLCCVVDTSAFCYVSLHPGCTALVRIIHMEDNGELVCRPASAVGDVVQLQKQLQDVYTAGMN